MEKLAIYCDNPVLRTNVEDLLAHYGYDALCQVTPCNAPVKDAIASIYLGASAPGQSGAEKTYQLDSPVRIGALFSRIETIAQNIKDSRVFTVGPYTLSAASAFLDGDKPVKITDTEKRLLILLAEQPGRPIKREALLRDVWGYRPDLDTHTVETHIYRLRQKIERDPSSPQILMTHDDGYMLA